VLFVTRGFRPSVGPALRPGRTLPRDDMKNKRFGTVSCSFACSQSLDVVYSLGGLATTAGDRHCDRVACYLEQCNARAEAKTYMLSSLVLLGL
jgi:hypothetical protein